jgi:DNA topoisomerase IB
VAVLEEGMKLREFGFSAADAQTLESRRFSITDVARIFNMPPHMLKDLGNATFSNISNQGEDFVRYCLGPWLTRIEQHYSTQLLSDAEVEKVFFEHNAEGLLRGNISERYSSYATGRQWGWLSINDIREKENENPLEEGGDIYMVPLNMMPAEDVGKTPEFAPGGTPPKPGGTPGQGTENKTAGRSDEEDDEVAKDWQDPFDERGSGNFGHAGRPGHVGGSATKGRPMSSIGEMVNCVRDLDESGEERKNPRPDPCKDIVKGKDGKYRLGGSEVSDVHQKRINALAIPPAWTNVCVARDKNTPMQAIGRAENTVWQYKYTKKWTDDQAAIKFDRGKSFSRDVVTMRKNNASGMNANNVNSHLLNILDKTAVRVGTNDDLKARVKAYGLTTFLNGHVKVKGSTVTLDFIAKEGIKAHYEFSDKGAAKFLSERISKTKKGDMLFPDTNANKLNKHITSMAGKKYTAKDFRTYHANRIALAELKPLAGRQFATKKEKQAAVKEVATKVSTFLRNTPDMAIKSYIEPMMWEHIGGLTWKK